MKKKAVKKAVKKPKDQGSEWSPWLRHTFSSMILVFIVLMTFFVLPGDKVRIVFMLYAILALAFLVLGIMLIVLAARSKLEKKMKVFLIIMGSSAGMVLVGTLLHNFLYAMAMLSEGTTWLVAVFEFLHAAFFIISLLVAPPAFLVGAGGVIFLKQKERR